MPAMNGTGPQGAGPMTGRGLGMCNKSDVSAQFCGNGRGMGMSRGSCGRGFGRRGIYTAPVVTPEEKKDMLKQQKTFLESQLASIDQQINEL